MDITASLTSSITVWSDEVEDEDVDEDDEEDVEEDREFGPEENCGDSDLARICGGETRLSGWRFPENTGCGRVGFRLVGDLDRARFRCGDGLFLSSLRFLLDVDALHLLSMTWRCTFLLYTSRAFSASWPLFPVLWSNRTKSALDWWQCLPGVFLWNILLHRTHFHVMFECCSTTWSSHFRLVVKLRSSQIPQVNGFWKYTKLVVTFLFSWPLIFNESLVVQTSWSDCWCSYTSVPLSPSISF